MSGRGETERIIIFSAGALGDVINLAPALCGLKAAWTAAEITGVGQLPWMELLAEGGVIHHALSLESPGLSALFSEHAALEQTLAAFLSRFHLAVSWMRNPALKARLEELGLRVVMYRGPFPPGPGTGPVSGTMASVLHELGIADYPKYPRLSPPAGHREITVHLLGRAAQGAYMVIHPGSGSPAKNWPTERFASLAYRIRTTYDLPVVLIFGPADEAVYQYLAPNMQHCILLTGLSPRQLAAVLYQARLFLGNDSGVAHLAGALGTPTIALYGPTDPQVWGVYQPNAVHLSSSLACAPCPDDMRRTCEERKCLTSLTEERVWQEITSFISAHPVIS